MNRLNLLVGLVLFYMIFIGLLGFYNPEGVTTADGNASNYYSKYTINESHTQYIYCQEKENPFFFTQNVLWCDDGNQFSFSEVEIDTNGDFVTSSGGFLGWIQKNLKFADSIITYIQRINTNISGMPTIVNIILFVPLGFLVLWVLIELAVWVIPFIGGGS